MGISIFPPRNGSYFLSRDSRLLALRLALVNGMKLSGSDILVLVKPDLEDTGNTLFLSP
jgi:hypothetical protein